MSAAVRQEQQKEARAKVVPSVLGIGVPAPPSDAPQQPAQDLAAYKKHSLAAGYWGGIPPSEQPLRSVGAEEARETFLKGLLATPTDRDRKSPAELFISLLVHVAIVAAVVIVPLMFTQAIDMSNVQATYLTLPKPPAPPPPPPSAPAQVARRAVHAIRPAVFTAPTVIPKKILQVKDEEAPDVAGGVFGGVPGGEAGGVLGGVLGGMPGPPAPAPPPPAAKKSVYRVGGEVKPPREISRVAPIYPIIAKTAKVEGVVVVDAVIDENGDVVQARGVSGPGLLIPEAVRAVLKWKYEPPYLNGMPVSVAMEVTVSFHLH